MHSFVLGLDRSNKHERLKAMVDKYVSIFDTLNNDQQKASEFWQQRDCFFFINKLIDHPEVRMRVCQRLLIRIELQSSLAAFEKVYDDNSFIRVKFLAALQTVGDDVTVLRTFLQILFVYLQCCLKIHSSSSKRKKQSALFFKNYKSIIY